MARTLAFTLRTHGKVLSKGGTGSDLYFNPPHSPHPRLPSGEWAAGSLGGSRVGEEATATVLAGEERAGLRWRWWRMRGVSFWLYSEGRACRGGVDVGGKGNRWLRGVEGDLQPAASREMGPQTGSHRS